MPDIPFHDHGIILFDGVCNYCSQWVDVVMKYDGKDYFRFATLQSEAGQNLSDQSYFSSQNIPGSVILVENGKMFLKSDAGLRIVRKLNFPFSLLFGFIIFPKFIRDGIYDFIANNRYKWFGKREICRMPVTEEEKRKFLN